MKVYEQVFAEEKEEELVVLHNDLDFSNVAFDTETSTLVGVFDFFEDIANYFVITYQHKFGELF